MCPSSSSWTPVACSGQYDLESFNSDAHIWVYRTPNNPNKFSKIDEQLEQSNSSNAEQSKKLIPSDQSDSESKYKTFWKFLNRANSPNTYSADFAWAWLR